MRIKNYPEFLAESAKPKPADVIVQSLETSPAAAGLRSLGAKVKSVGQHRVVITGIPDRVVETPEHPDNPSSSWRSYRKRPTRFNPVYAEEFFPNLDEVWKAMWKNVVKNLTTLKVPGKRAMDTAEELISRGVDHTSGLNADALLQTLIDEERMPDMGKILDHLSDLTRQGWIFLPDPRVNYISLRVQTPREEILDLYNLPLRGASISGRVSPVFSHFALALTKMQAGEQHQMFLHGTEQELASLIRRELQSRMDSFHVVDLLTVHVNEKRIPGNLKMLQSPFLLYVSKMRDFLKGIPIEDLDKIGGKILQEAQRFFRSEDGSVLLAFLDERYGLEPKAQTMVKYRVGLLDEYEGEPDEFQEFIDAIPEQKKDAILGPDLSALIKANNLIL
jgi:hypothetical protein